MLGKPLDYKVPGLRIIYPLQTIRKRGDEYFEEYRMAWKFYFEDCPYGREYIIDEEELEYADWFVRNILYPHAFRSWNELNK